MKPHHALLTLFALMHFEVPILANNFIYCASNCADYINACFGPSLHQCSACQEKLFQRNSDNGTCIEKPYNQIRIEELRNQDIDLTGYSTNNPIPVTCGIYGLSGQYTANSYLSKTFSGLGKNHHKLVIRFGIGYIGAWDQTDQMQLKIDGVIYQWPYYCSYPSDICSMSGIDCFKIIEFDILHDRDELTLNFTSDINETDPNVKYWGVKDISILSVNCYSKCSTCTGSESSDCTSCMPGFFLQGNVCVSHCDDFTIPSIRHCSKYCPIRYFSTSSKQCHPCIKGCIACRNSNSCDVWQDGSTTKSLWQKHLLLWIILIVSGFSLIFVIFWKCVLKKHVKKLINDLEEEHQSEVSDANNSLHKKMVINDEDMIDQKDNENKSQKMKNNYLSEQKMNTGHESSSQKIIDSSSIWVEDHKPVEPIKVENVNERKIRQKQRKRRRRFEIKEEIENVNVEQIVDLDQLPYQYQNRQL